MSSSATVPISDSVVKEMNAHAAIIRSAAAPLDIAPVQIGWLAPLVSTFPLSQIDETIEAVHQGKAIKAVLTFDESDPS